MPLAFGAFMSGCPPLYSEEERKLLSLVEAVKEIYVGHVDAFVNEGKKLMGSASPHKPDLRLNPHLWDFRAQRVRVFLEAGAGRGGWTFSSRVMILLI